MGRRGLRSAISSLHSNTFEFTPLERRVLLSASPVPDDMGYFPALEPAMAALHDLEPQSVAADGPLRSLSSLPQLNSRPGAHAQLVLDFDGDGPRQWGGFNVPATPAYDIDGDPTTFSAQELSNIEQIWARVAEKYSPFDINVTTVDTGNLTNRETMKIVIGGNGSWYPVPVGGLAFLGSFYNNQPNVAYVFPANLANGNPKFTAEASAHEAGHGFGLQHQSTYDGDGNKLDEYNSGTSAWAPIMGVSYNADRGTWWNGPSSISSTSLQDDLQILANNLNGFGYRPDDHGDTIAAATPLAADGSSISGSGVIERMTDVDVFSFIAGTGPLSITAGVVQHGPTLDLTLELLDSNGEPVAAGTGAGLGKSLSTSVVGGTYFVRVGSAGQYGDVGQYTLSGTIVPPKLLQFSQSVYTVREDAGVAVITVTRSDSGAETFTVDYAVADGTARAGEHYEAASGTLTFSGGQTSRTIEIPIIDNDLIDGDKTVLLSLSNPSGEALLGQSSATLTILDNNALVRFAANRYVVRNTAEFATITISRAGSRIGGLSIDYSVAGGTAEAGLDFAAVSGTLTFAPEQMHATVQIPILGYESGQAIRTVLLQLENPAGGSLPAQPGITELTILDSAPPVVTSIHTAASRKGIQEIHLVFDKPMDAFTASDLANYAIVARGNDGRFGAGNGRTVPLRSATYNAATQTVVLAPHRPMRLNQVFHLNVRGAIGPADIAGNRITGTVAGQPGTDYNAFFARGSRISFVERNGNTVNLSLSHGSMELIRGFNGDAQELRLFRTQPGVSALTGDVRPRPGGAGQATLASLSGANGVDNRLSDRILIDEIG